MVGVVRSRASFFLATLILAVCFVCQVAEMFDYWDHTLQTGNDTEYTFVVIALCMGVAFSLKWFVPAIALLDSRTETISHYRSRPLFSIPTDWFSVVPISASPPTVALRI